MYPFILQPRVVLRWLRASTHTHAVEIGQEGLSAEGELSAGSGKGKRESSEGGYYVRTGIVLRVDSITGCVSCKT
jgi:hypothetical protein